MDDLTTTPFRLSKMPVTYQGRTLTLREWAARLRLEYTTVSMRYKRGDRGAHLLRPTPARRKNSDIPTRMSRNRDLRSAAYTAALDLLPLHVRPGFIAGFDNDPQRIDAYLRTVMADAATRVMGISDLPLHDPAWKHPYFALLHMCPDEQRIAVMRKFMATEAGTAHLVDIFVAALRKIMPKLVEKVTGIEPYPVVDEYEGKDAETMQAYAEAYEATTVTASWPPSPYEPPVDKPVTVPKARLRPTKPSATQSKRQAYLDKTYGEGARKNY